MKTRTFAEIYCEREELSPEAFRAILFRRTLYPHARLVAGLVRWLKPRHFLADYEFIEDVGYLRSLQEFSGVLESYVEHPSNRNMLRRRFRIRVSARRMLNILCSDLAQAGPAKPALRSDRNTFEPFGICQKDPSGATQTKAASPAH